MQSFTFGGIYQETCAWYQVINYRKLTLCPTPHTRPVALDKLHQITGDYQERRRATREWPFGIHGWKSLGTSRASYPEINRSFI